MKQWIIDHFAPIFGISVFSAISFGICIYYWVPNHPNAADKEAELAQIGHNAGLKNSIEFHLYSIEIDLPLAQEAVSNLEKELPFLRAPGEIALAVESLRDAKAEVKALEVRKASLLADQAALARLSAAPSRPSRR